MSTTEAQKPATADAVKVPEVVKELTPEEEQSLRDEEELMKEAKRIKDNEDYGDPGSDFEWASDVDSQGK